MKFSVLLALVFMLLSVAARAAARIELIEGATTVVVREGELLSIPLRGSAQPGQRIRYTIVAKNVGDRPAAQLVPMAKIPAGERFVAGSAGTAAEYSIDNGKTWSRRPMVRATDPGGATTIRPALAAEYTAVRWTGTLPLPPGGRATFAYDVIVE